MIFFKKISLKVFQIVRKEAHKLFKANDIEQIHDMARHMVHVRAQKGSFTVHIKDTAWNTHISRKVSSLQSLYKKVIKHKFKNALTIEWALGRITSLHDLSKKLTFLHAP